MVYIARSLGELPFLWKIIGIIIISLSSSIPYITHTMEEHNICCLLPVLTTRF